MTEQFPNVNIETVFVYKLTMSKKKNCKNSFSYLEILHQSHVFILKIFV